MRSFFILLLVFAFRPLAARVLAQWDFTAFTNATARTVDVTDDVLSADARLGGTGLRLMAHLGGFVQIGGYGNTGELTIGPLAARTHRVIVRAARHNNRDYGRHMPLALEDAHGARTHLSVLELSDTLADHPLVLPDDADGKRLVLSCTTNHLAASNPRCAVNLAAVTFFGPTGLALVVR